MDNSFLKYMEMGAFHILDLGGMDHLYFITSLVLVYSFVAWRRVLLLLTAFTLGHGVALLFVATELMPISSEVIEFLIPLTIVITALLHLWRGRTSGNWIYGLCILFGLIHGTAYGQGFAGLFGRSEEVILPTIGFNLGVELGQGLFAILLLAMLELLSGVFGLSRDKVRIFIFGMIIALGCQLIWHNRIW